MPEVLSFEGDVKYSGFDSFGNRPWKSGKIVITCNNAGIAECLEMHVNATSACLHKWMVRNIEICKIYV